MSRVKLSSYEVTDQFCRERQGCNLSPLLFSLFISEKKKKWELDCGTDQPIDLLMYADDIVLMCSSEEGLRKHLKSLEEFCKQ